MRLPERVQAQKSMGSWARQRNACRADEDWDGGHWSRLGEETSEAGGGEGHDAIEAGRHRRPPAARAAPHSRRLTSVPASRLVVLIYMSSSI